MGSERSQRLSPPWLASVTARASRIKRACHRPGAPRARPAPGSSKARGITLLEVAWGVLILAIAVLSVASTTAVSLATKRQTRETALAALAARAVLERLDDGEVPFHLLFAAHVGQPATPLPEGTVVPSRPRTFEVPGLEPRADDPDGLAGEVLFPTVDTPTGVALREDRAGRDLNGDGVLDEKDHSADYRILPVTVVVRWQDPRGPREFELPTLLTAR